MTTRLPSSSAIPIRTPEEVALAPTVAQDQDLPEEEDADARSNASATAFANSTGRMGAMPTSSSSSSSRGSRGGMSPRHIIHNKQQQSSSGNCSSSINCEVTPSTPRNGLSSRANPEETAADEEEDLTPATAMENTGSPDRNNSRHSSIGSPSADNSSSSSSSSSGLSTVGSNSTTQNNNNNNNNNINHIHEDDETAEERAAAAAAAAAAASLPQHNLYESLVRYQEDHEIETGSVPSETQTLRSASTWYSVRSDDDRKIPARPPPEGSYEGTYRAPIRRPYRPPNSASGNSSSNNSSGHNSTSNSTGSNTPGFGNHKPAAATATATSTISHQPAALARMSTPPTIREDPLPTPSRTTDLLPSDVEYDNEKDDQTILSSLVQSTDDWYPAPPSRFPLSVLDEGRETGAAIGATNCRAGGEGMISSSSVEGEFACLSAAAQLAQESQMGNMYETTRSAPNPYGSSCTTTTSNSGSGTGKGNGAAGACPGPDNNNHGEWWAFQSLVAGEGVFHPVSEPNNRLRSRAVMTTTASTRSVDPTSSSFHNNTHTHNNNTARGRSPPSSEYQQHQNQTSHDHNSRSTSPTSASASSARINEYTRMQETLGMQHLTSPMNNTSGNSGNASWSGGSGGSACSSHLSGSGGGGGGGGGRIRSAQHQHQHQHQHQPEHQQYGDRYQQCNINNSASTSSRANSEDPATQEQYRIWKQIQAELEQKEIQLALQLSEKETANQSANGSSCGSFEYPSQQAKAPSSQCSSANNDDDEDSQLREALRISQEEAARHQSSTEEDDDEDEIALALRLSAEQAEADRRRLQQLQETAGEMSEEEQLRLAMEQSMAASMPQNRKAHGNDDDTEEQLRRALEESLQQPQRAGRDRSDDGDDSSTVDEEMRLALRLSQAQLAEEERIRESFLMRDHSDASHIRGNPSDLIKGNDSFTDMIQPFPSSSPDPMRLREEHRRPPASRSPPPQESLSPSLNSQRKSSRGRWGRIMKGGRREETAPVAGIPDAIPPHTPPPEDIACLSHQKRREQKSPLRGFVSSSMSSLSDDFARRVRAPDEDLDPPPHGGLRRRDQSQQGPSTSPPRRTRDFDFDLDVDEDTRNLLVREGQVDTRMAIMQGQSQIVVCRGCLGRLHAPVQCSLVFCPSCNTVSPIEIMDCTPQRG